MSTPETQETRQVYSEVGYCPCGHELRLPNPPVCPVCKRNIEVLTPMSSSPREPQKDREWIAEKARQEDGCPVSVGGSHLEPQNGETPREALRQSTARIYPDVGYERHLDEITSNAAEILADCADEHTATFIRQITETVSHLRSTRDELRRDIVRVALAVAAPEPREPHAALIAEIRAYLASGGLFNPELANHDNVRDLLMRCEVALKGA